MSLVHGDDHYKALALDSVRVARTRTVTAQWPRVPSIDQFVALHRKCQISEKFTGNSDVSKKVKKKTPKQTNKQLNKVTLFNSRS